MINTENYELYFFQYQEGLLDEKGRHEVELFLKAHPELAEELTLYAESPVLESEDISFEGKGALKHQPAFGWWKYAAAAVVVGAIGVSFFLTRPTTQRVPEPIIASTVNPVSPSLPKEELPLFVNPGPRVAKLSKATPKPHTLVPSLSNVCENTSVDRVGETLSDTTEEVPVEAVHQEVIPPSQDLAEVMDDNSNLEESNNSAQIPQSSIIVHDYSDMPLSDALLELTVDRFPEQAIQLTSLSAKVVDFSQRVKNSNIVNIIRSII